MTHPQGGMLFSLTRLKFWEPENVPQPTKRQASLLIEAILVYVKEKTNGPEVTEAIQIWFPSFTDLSTLGYRFSKKKKAGEKTETENQPEAEKTTNSSGSASGDLGYNPKNKGGKGGGGGSFFRENGKDASPKTETETKAPEQKPEKRKNTTPKPKENKSEGLDLVKGLIEAGIQNIWMVGPAGCGKTTICQLTGDALDMPVTVIPCGAGTSATTFLGYKYPEREGTPFVQAFGQEGIIVLDEFTALEAQVAQIVNGALANNELTATTGTVQRHENCVIIATSNTFGKGGDRQYVANQQLDASTIDRFACGIVEIEYSDEYESQFDSEVVEYCRNLRKLIFTNGFREIVSTRSIIAACKLKEAGFKTWKESITVNWTKDEKACIR